MAEAPAKLILFGEHAVVYGYPGIAVPLHNLTTEVTIEESDNLSYSVDRVLYEEEKEKLYTLLEFLFMELDIMSNNVRIYIKSTVPVGSGLGSSAALSVSLIKALSDHFGLSLDEEEINRVAFECEKFFHGNPSGIDNTVVTYAKSVFFKDNKKEFIEHEPLLLVIADTGKKPKTEKVVSEVRKKYEADKEVRDTMEDIGKISEKARMALAERDLEKLGKLMTENHAHLKKLELSNKKIDSLVETAIGTGALGAKLCGAGKGGNICALVSEELKDEVKEALEVFSDNVMVVKVK